MFVEKGSRKKSSVRSGMLIYNFKTRALALKVLVVQGLKPKFCINHCPRPKGRGNKGFWNSLFINSHSPQMNNVTTPSR